MPAFLLSFGSQVRTLSPHVQKQNHFLLRIPPTLGSLYISWLNIFQGGISITEFEGANLGREIQVDR